LEELKAYRTPGAPATKGFKQRRAKLEREKLQAEIDYKRKQTEGLGQAKAETPYEDPLANPYIKQFQSAVTDPTVQQVPGQLESMVPQLQEYLKGTNRYLDAPRTVKPQGWWDKLKGNAPEMEYMRPPVVRSRRDKPPSMLKPPGGSAPMTSQAGTQGRTVEKQTKDGRIAIFDAITKQFIRYK